MKHPTPFCKLRLNCIELHLEMSLFIYRGSCASQRAECWNSIYWRVSSPCTSVRNRWNTNFIRTTLSSKCRTKGVSVCFICHCRKQASPDTGKESPLLNLHGDIQDGSCSPIARVHWSYWISGRGLPHSKF